MTVICFPTSLEKSIKLNSFIQSKLLINSAEFLQLSEKSRNEQKSAGLVQLTPDEFAEFKYLNTTYMNKYGFPFIIAVKGLTKIKILSQFKKRVENSKTTEFNEACHQVEKIAYIRIRNIID